MCVDGKKIIQAMGFYPKDNTSDIFTKKYKSEYNIDVDLKEKTIYYGGKIKVYDKDNQKITKAEDWVVLECVNRLLEIGYNPQNIQLEKVYPAGHRNSGRLDICVNREDGSEYLLIECKVYGKEFEKEFKRMNKDGGQLFTYFKFSNKPDLIMLYSSQLKEKEIIYKNEIIKIEESYRIGDVKDFYDKWNKLTKDNGVFDYWVKPYDYKSKALTINDLEEIKPEDSSFIFNRFLEILRHNVVSDKPNAFNKIFTLFLCKIYDEKSKDGTDKELKFQWIDGKDDDVSFQLRLTDLYKKGMEEFLDKKVTDFSDDDFNSKYASLFADNENLKDLLKADIAKLRLEKNNEFAIKEVYDEKSFLENAKVVKEVVELLQSFKIRYTQKQQYLSDFFELLLTTGLKQESGQFFTPVPIAQFVIKSLPIDKIVKAKLDLGKKDDLLPFVIDYAAGSGHFLTESMHEIQRLLLKVDTSKLKSEAKSFVDISKIRHFDWALQYIYGIEKDYRLVKVGKVGCYLHGDGLANVIHSDGLSNFKHKDYKGKLKETDKDFIQENKQFEILISNPPYSVSAFKNTSREYYRENDFELYNKITDSSSEIECLFIERTKQLLKDGGIAGVILPSSILNNTGIYTRSREIIFRYFEIIGITKLGSNTFMATGTNTVILFLRRRNNYENTNIEISVGNIFSNYKDNTVNKIEKPLNKYINYVWGDISFDDYISLLKKRPNEIIKNHEIYKEYSKEININKEEEFLKRLLEVEKEKFLYYIIAYPQKVVLVKSGEKSSEKRFLGYEFSNRRGSEGIHPIQKGKSIEDCTQMFDTEVFENPAKASTYIYKAFNGDYNCDIDDSMKNNVSRHNLIDMMTFDRGEFEKTISLNIKKKIKIESKWKLQKLGEILNEKAKSKIKVNIAKEMKNGEYPFYTSGESIFKFNNFLVEGQNIYLSTGGNAIINFFDGKSSYSTDTFVVNSRNEDKIKTKFIYYFLSSIISEINEFYFKGVGLKHLQKPDFRNIKIPIPPMEIQQKIISSIEVLEAKEKKAKDQIEKDKETIINLFIQLELKADKEVRLSDGKIFQVSIGKRVVKKEFVENGKIPVYSANVIEPFGNIDKLLIEDFSKPSVLWGIDGDWMVNYIPNDYPFYPTDHCGVLRVKDDSINEKYLAFILEKEGKAFEFSRAKRASIDRIQGIKIPVPPILEQEKTVFNIKIIEKQIEKNENILSEIPRKKEEILKKYL